MMNSKKGISIVAVLLFMLIATIAGTATYRWLSSENRSSASRMFQNEARLAAVAGIESARSWFAHHGNETGSVVRQFASAKGSNRAVKLDNQLVAIKKDKQNYSVYVVDVDESEQPYKIKVVSEGFSRDGSAKHSETAVFKVSGLYRVSNPPVIAPMDYNYSYFGGSTTMGTNTKVESMLVNGNLDGSQISVTEKLVVTGNVAHQGTDHMALAKTSCIGGSLTLKNQALEAAQDLYVGGDVVDFSFSSNVNPESDRVIKGDVYIGGNVNVSGTGWAPKILKNFTLANGTFTANKEKKFEVLGNLCLGKNSVLDFNLGSSSNTGFTIGGDVWIPGENALKNSGTDHYKKNSLGGDGRQAFVKSSGRCPTGGSYNETQVSDGFFSSHYELQVASKTKWGYKGCPSPSGLYFQGAPKKAYSDYDQYGKYCLFTTKATQHSDVSESAAKDGVTCTESLEAACEELLTPSTKGCDKSSYKIDDLLQVAASSFGEKASACVNDKINDQNNLMNGKGIDLLNGCYKDGTSNNDLYNGYLVVKANADAFGAIFKSFGQKKLKGKFILYVDGDDKLGYKEQVWIPPTEPYAPGKKSIVFLYLPHGATTVTKSGKGDHNYFVFSEGSITNLQQPSDQATNDWYGSFYLTASNCSRIENVQNTQTFNYDAEIVNDLKNSGVICNASASVCGDGTSSSGSGSGSTTENAGSNTSTLDSVRVAVGASLLVELESQYKTTEKISAFEDVKPSVIVMPRIVYINSDAEGKLSDYFNPVATNGVGSLGSGALSCSDTRLQQNPLPLLDADTKATCEYSVSDESNSYKSSFHVMIQGPSAAIPKVGFDGDATVNIDTDTQEEQTIPVKMNVGAVLDGSGQYSMDIVVTGHMDWVTANTSSNFTLVSESDKEKRFHLTGQMSSSEVQIQLFTVKASSSTGTGNVVFSIENVDNCTPVAAVKAITVSGSMRVVRRPLSEYCQLDNHDADVCDEVGSDAYKNTPSCENMIVKNFGNAYEWVAAYGDECRALDPNDKWKCNMGVSIDLVKKNSSTIEEYCDVVIPSTNNSIVTFADNGDQYLYADVKHKKYKLDLYLENKGSGSVIIYYSTTAYASAYDIQQAIADNLMDTLQCHESHCEKVVYAGYHYYLKGVSTEDSPFSYWKKPSETNSTIFEQVEGNPYHILIKKDEVAYAVFNARDDHCFYDNFDNLGVFCDDNSCPSNSQSCNCIDRCTNYKDVSVNCSVNGGHSYSNANWVMVYANDPEGTKGGCNKYGLNCQWKDYFEPVKKDNGLYYSGTIDLMHLDGDAQNDGRESVILSYVDAGTNGTLSASYSVADASYFSNMDKKALNSGFILRSNDDATKYLILAPYGKNVFGGNTGSWSLYLRVCYVDKSNSNTSNGGKTLTSASTCSAEQKLEFSYTKTNATASAFNKFNIEATLQGDVLNVAVGLEGVFVNSSLLMKNVSFNLAQSPLKSLYSTSVSDDFAKNKYVGFKLADKGFKVYDIAWRSNSEDCWDTPYASCNFASNYIGGRAPLAQDVMPWVNTSTWLSNKVESNSCQITYFYNGCDMDNGRYDYTSLNSIANGVADFIACSGNSSTGYYWGDADGGKNGIALKENTKYNFKYEGLHGEPVTSPKAGIVRNASVRITCEGMKRSFVANCGSFWVGPINECTKNETLLPNENPDYASGFEYSVSVLGNDASLVLDKAVNLRNATLRFTLNDGAAQISFYLKDSNGKLSSPGTIDATQKSVSVETLIDEFGFDPENVVEIIFNSGNTFVITEIKSECSSAPAASCSVAEFDAESGVRLYGTATNADACSMTVTDAEGSNTVVSGTVVCAQNPIVLSSDAAKALTAGDYKVSLTVTKGDVSETCAPVSMAVGSTPSGKPPLPGYAKSAKSASCTRDDEGVFHITVNGCESNDDCSIKTRRGDYEPEVVCNWVTSGCDVTLYNSGTYDILFYDGSSDLRLAGCSGITVE